MFVSILSDYNPSSSVLILFFTGSYSGLLAGSNGSTGSNGPTSWTDYTGSLISTNYSCSFSGTSLTSKAWFSYPTPTSTKLISGPIPTSTVF